MTLYNDSEPMTWQVFDRRHGERYAKIMRREMTLAMALAQNEADWRALVEAGLAARAALPGERP